MRSRNLLYVACALLLLVVITASLAAREQRSTEAVAPPPQAAAAPPAPVVRGVLPRDRVLRAQVGDTVQVQVRPPIVAEVSIDAVGVSAVADPQEPATLEFEATAPGRYPVTEDDTGATLGTVVVSAP